MLMIRYQRIGRTNDPAFRIVLLEKARAARTGRIVEQLGTYNPKTKALRLDEARIKEWVGKGAQPTDTVRNLLITKGVLEGKKADVFPASGRKKMAEAAAKAVAETAAAAKAAEEVITPVAPEGVVLAAEETIPETPIAQSNDGAGPSVS
ncbi:MAG: 30S ribosomal protein S16 [bacterium]|nr:30S ribosomal protein S16 [bacterium]